MSAKKNKPALTRKRRARKAKILTFPTTYKSRRRSAPVPKRGKKTRLIPKLVVMHPAL